MGREEMNPYVCNLKYCTVDLRNDFKTQMSFVRSYVSNMCVTHVIKVGKIYQLLKTNKCTNIYFVYSNTRIKTLK
jgi:hypothetical protein